jgi:hypothetical protein
VISRNSTNKQKICPATKAASTIQIDGSKIIYTKVATNAPSMNEIAAEVIASTIQARLDR